MMVLAEVHMLRKMPNWLTILSELPPEIGLFLAGDGGSLSLFSLSNYGQSIVWACKIANLGWDAYVRFHFFLQNFCARNLTGISK